MGDRIAVDIDALAELRTRILGLAQDLRGSRSTFSSDALRHSPRSADAMERFHGDWSDKRGKLIERVDTAARDLGAVGESFADVDGELARAVDGPGPDPGAR